MSYSGSIESRKYPGNYARSWREDTVATREGDKGVLRVVFELNGESIEWTCWEEMEKDGKPSSNARGLAALGVTKEDLRTWASGGELQGLDRNAVDLVVEFNEKGYPYVKWVNDPREQRAAKPLDKGARASFAKRAAQALAQLPASPAQSQERTGPPPGRMQPPPQSRRSPAEDPGFNPDSWDDKAF